MSGSKDGRSILPPDKCFCSAPLSDIERIRVSEQEAEIMRLSADPLLIHQYLDEFGCRNCSESYSLRHLQQAMSDCAGSSLLIACTNKSENLRDISLDKGLAFLATYPRSEVSVVPEPFCASRDDKKLALDLVEIQLAARVNLFILAYHNMRKMLWAVALWICQARQP